MDYASLTPFTVKLNNGVDITFAAGQLTATSAPQPAQGDDVYLDGQVIPVSIASISGPVVGSAAATGPVNATVDPTTVNLSASTVLEGGVATYVFTATLSSVSHGNTVITTDQGVITVTDGNTTGTLTIASGNGEDVYLDASQLTATITNATGGNFEHLVVGKAAA